MLNGFGGKFLIKMNRLHLSVLLAAIFTLICSGNAFSQYPAPRNDPIVIQVVELDYAVAEELVEVLTPFLSKDGRISAYGPGNVLIIKDRKTIVEALVKVIKGRLSSDK
jgi:type II secretory pathway component GspD/PulD (secretin)